ncbi:MAG: DNA polymerase III subunit delta [Planctomycetota bacterium]|nr:DNA polymerase III subunit delta [Planctomycetota bacterium]
MANLTAFEFLDPQDQPASPAAINVIYGDEPFLKRQALARIQQLVLGDDPEIASTTFDGATALWRNVADELATLSLFGAGKPRLVVIDAADSRGPQGQDSFLSRSRHLLETYITQPVSSGVLVLLVNSWPANTRLFKALTNTGLQIAARAPQQSGRGAKGVDEQAVENWIVQWAQSRHQIVVAATAARTLLQLVGPHFGLLDQELAKLALFVTPEEPVADQLVAQVTGGWQNKTMWEVLAAAASGETAIALEHLDHLLQSGQHPNALFGQISWSLRRFATATQYFQPPRNGSPESVGNALQTALQQAGVRDWPKGNLRSAAAQLRQLGSARAKQLLTWLLEADLALKGSHANVHRARFVLEKLFLKMSKAARV